MSVTAAKGFTAAGIAAGIKANGSPDLALVVNNGPAPRRRRASSPPTGSRPRPCCGRSRCSRAARSTAVVLNSGGANACTGPQGFQDTHATAEKAAEVLGHSAGEIAVASTGLIGVRLPMDKLLPGIEKAAGRTVRARRREGRHRHQDHRHRAQDGRRRAATAGPSAAWPRAPACSPRASPPCWSCSPPTPTSDAAALDTALRDATRTTFDRVDSDGCMSTNDTVLLLASGASGVTPDVRRVRRGGPRRSAPTSPGS